MSADTTPPPRRVILVDGEDTPLGVAGVHASHDLPGEKHRAFTAVLWDAAGSVLLARRSSGKRLWPGFWDATVASHPQPGEVQVASGERRIEEELGTRCALAECGRFDYAIAYGTRGAENEVCATLIGQLAADQALRPDVREVDAVRAIAPSTLLGELAARPLDFCPWLFLAFLILARDRESLPDSLGATVETLARAGTIPALEAGLVAHFPSATWRLLD